MHFVRAHPCPRERGSRGYLHLSPEGGGGRKGGGRERRRGRGGGGGVGKVEGVSEGRGRRGKGRKGQTDKVRWTGRQCKDGGINPCDYILKYKL